MRVLIVDDTESIRYSVAMLLNLENFECEEATCVEHALACLRSSQNEGKDYDAILLDLTMPGEPASKLVSAINSLDSSVRPEIILCSASSAIEDEARRLGIDRVLSKPFIFDDLLNTLRGAHRSRSSLCYSE